MKEMPDTKIPKGEQFYFENRVWERLLEFLKQENAFLKTRLAEVLDQSTDKGFLCLAEQFQNKFILKDEFIDELRHDINTQQRLLKENYINPLSGLDKKIIKNQEKLCNEMAFLEKDFPRMKNEFIQYLAGIA